MRYLALTALAGAAALAAAAPAAAQPVEEVTVTGHLSGARVNSLSEAVSYADLDLARHADREILRVRVNTTARRLCTQLNQDSPSPANLGKSCQDFAVRDAMDQVHQAFADASANAAYVDSYGAPVSATVPDEDRRYDPDPY